MATCAASSAVIPERVRKPGHARIPELDGLRGMAILLVLAFHFRNFVGDRGVGLWAVDTAASMGWCGVDLFFALSGFLITGILLDSAGAPNHRRNFYMRRALRIL